MDRKWHRFTPLALLGLLLIVAVPMAQAQPVDFEEETHFRCYTVSNQTPEPANLVTLDDQFLPPTHSASTSRSCSVLQPPRTGCRSRSPRSI